MKQKELLELIAAYDKAYYEDGNELVTNAEYDALKSKLNLEETKVPGNALFNKVEHTTPILSLDKVKITDQEALCAHLERLWPVCIEPKLDGLTMVIYNNNTLFVTRGDGLMGEDVTSNCKDAIQLGEGIAYPIRGEAVMLKTDFERLNKERIANGEEPFKNARNAAAGMLRQKDSGKVKGITLITYEIIGSEILTPDMQVAELSEGYNWNAVECYTPSTIDEAISYINNYDKNSYICDIDGLVVKHIGDKTFGATSHHPNGSIAIKFSSDKKWTKLKNIEWGVGRSGKVVPVAEFEPIDLMGSTVSKATLHNTLYINGLKLNVNAFRKEVCVTKANDIIPAIIDARIMPKYAMLRDIHYLDIPTQCPACGTTLVQNNDQLFCTNEYCIEKVIAQAVHTASRQALDINGLSEETIRKMYDTYNQTTTTNFVFPLYFEYEHILGLEGFAEKSAQKLANEIENKCRNPIMSRFLIACGIPLLGKTASRLIAKEFSNLAKIETDLTNGAESLLAIDGIGDELVKNLRTHWWRIDALLDVVGAIKPETDSPSKTVEKQFNFVITGKFEKPRSYYEDLITAAGHNLVNSVSAKTDYLIIENIQSSSSKAKKARNLNITLIDDKQLLKILESLK